MHRVISLVAKQVTKQVDFGKDLLLGLSRRAAIAVPLVFILAQVSHAHSQAATDIPAAPNLGGTWQGTLHAGQDLREVFKISRAAGGGYTASLYSMDTSFARVVSAAPVSTITLQGTTVKASFPAISGTYEGKLSVDGQTIQGIWSQVGSTFPLTLVRATPATEWTIPKPASIPPMAADAAPTFAVATIKPARPDELGGGMALQGQRVVARSTSLMNLISFAYGVHSEQIMNAPVWAETERYDIVAEPDVEGRPNDKQMKSMVQKLLAERYKLGLHHGSKVLPIYVLSIAKREPILTRSDSDPNGPPVRSLNFLGGLVLRNVTIGDFANDLQADILDRPVVDQTGIAGKYDLTLKWTPDDSQFPNYGTVLRPPVDADTAPPDLFTAIQEQLGLKLESTKASVDVLVIDHVEKPSEN